MPSVRNLVQFLETCGQSAQSAFLGLCLLDEFINLTDNRVNLREVLLHVLLSNGEERALGFLHQVGNIDCSIKSFCLNKTGKGDELALQGLLGDYLGVIFDMGRAGNLRIDLH